MIMSVRLILWMSKWPQRKKPFKHPTCHAFMSCMASEPDYLKWDRFKRWDYLDTVLSTYNGCVVHFDRMKVEFEFESEEDLAQFVLAWS